MLLNMYTSRIHSIYDCAIKFYDMKLFDDAIREFEKLPQTPDILFNIATCHKDKNTHDSMLISIDLFQTLIVQKHKQPLCDNIKTNYISVITMLSKYYTDNAIYNNAIRITQKSLLYIPNNPILLYNLGFMYKCIGEYDNAITYFLKSLDYDKSKLDTYTELINIYRDRNEPHNVIKYIENGIKYVSYPASLYNDMGLYYVSHDHEKAIQTFEKALKISVNDSVMTAKIYTNLGHVYSNRGDTERALHYYDKACNTCPTDMIPKQNYVMDMLYLDNINYNTILRKHMEVGFAVHNHNNKQLNISYDKYISGKIKIGYISGDFFGSHPMTHFLKALLTQYNTNNFELFCYCIDVIGDTQKYSSLIKWRSVKYLSTIGCIKQIHNDGINVLIDLSGHTAHNRLDVFSNRIAQLQLSYLGYPCITGMPEIDFYIIDKTFEFNKCKTISMPRCFTHYSAPFIPKVLKQPFLHNGFITFGSLNKASKINNSVISLWDRVLDSFPDAILIIKRIPNIERFKNNSRVKVIELTANYNDYIEQYNLIDIALDPFPYAGTTTTCESLLMGTPVITLSDKLNYTIHQNTTASLLINSDMSDLVAKNTTEYIDIIHNVISNISNIVDYKKIIQTKFLNGFVTDANTYINDFEKLIKQLLHTK